MNLKKDRGIIAFDGLSLAGKSTMVQMLSLRSKDAVVIRENELDPLRESTSRLNKLLKNTSSYHALINLSEEFKDNDLVVQTCHQAIRYIDSMSFEGPNDGKFKQAALAYFFTKGRSYVSKEVLRQVTQKNKDIILDRWWVSGMAYQVQPDIQTARKLGLSEDITGRLDCEDDPYRWKDIKDLNIDYDILVPNMQVILTCPVDQIPQRRAYRQKQGRGTSGQMSSNREELIYHSLMQIYDWLSDNDLPTNKIENHGTPVDSLKDQIRQAIPTYLKLEDHLREDIQRPDSIFKNFRLSDDPFSLKEAQDFFLEDSNMKSIYERQCLGKVKDNDKKI